ncbi:MAG: hypothetical protein ACRDOH_30035 [Streptosporangiaceae bacterium]
MKEQLGTRVEVPLGQRLRVYAAVNRRTVAEVVGAALDSYLPPLADLVRAAESGSAAREISGHGRSDAVLAAGGQVAS